MAETAIQVEENTAIKESEIEKELERQGCVFHKREKPVSPPEIDEDKIDRVFKEDAEVVKEGFIPNLLAYLEKIPITDRHGNNDDKRKKWRETLDPPVRGYYEKNNQLRVNNISIVLSSIKFMAWFLDNKKGRRNRRYKKQA